MEIIIFLAAIVLSFIYLLFALLSQEYHINYLPSIRGKLDDVVFNMVQSVDDSVQLYTNSYDKTYNNIKGTVARKVTRRIFSARVEIDKFVSGKQVQGDALEREEVSHFLKNVGKVQPTKTTPFQKNGNKEIE